MCGLSGGEEDSRAMAINGITMPWVENFKYLGLFLLEKEVISEYINYRIKVG